MIVTPRPGIPTVILQLMEVAMVPRSPAPGTRAGGSSAPPLDPSSLAALLDRDPARAAAILAAMRPAQRRAQVQANARAAGVPAAQIDQAWRDLIARVSLAPSPQDAAPAPCAAVYDPDWLAARLAADPARARALLARLTSAQMTRMAVAYAAWLEGHGVVVTVPAVLHTWDLTQEEADYGA